jgi:peroxiredoxin
MLSLVAYFRPSRSSGIVPPRLDQPLSEFQLADLNGKWVNLGDFKGQVVLINTWATWCPPCRAEMPDLNAFYNQYQDKGFAVVAINAGEALTVAADFALEYGLDFTVVVDPDYRVMDGFKINTYPTSILIDRKGVIRDIRVGMHSQETLAAVVLPLLSK